MAIERLSETSEWPGTRPAIPGWLWTLYTTDLPAEPHHQPLNVAGIVNGLGALLTELGVLAPDPRD